MLEDIDLFVPELDTSLSDQTERRATSQAPSGVTTGTRTGNSTCCTTTGGYCCITIGC
jgi:hypothetical protein